MKDLSDVKTPDMWTEMMVPKHATDTQIAAAASVLDRLSELQDKVLRALQQGGPQTDMELEVRPEFRDCAETTVSKRRTDLKRKGLVRDSGKRRLNANKRWAIVWEAVKPGAAPFAPEIPEDHEGLIDRVLDGRMTLAEFARRKYQQGYAAGRAKRLGDSTL